MSDEEILRLLNISTESTFFKKIVRTARLTGGNHRRFSICLQRSTRTSNGRSSLLMSMLTSIASWLPGSSQSSGTQTANDLWAGSIAGSTLGKISLKSPAHRCRLHVRPSSEFQSRRKAEQSRCDVQQSSRWFGLDAQLVYRRETDSISEEHRSSNTRQSETTGEKDEAEGKEQQPFLSFQMDQFRENEMKKIREEERQKCQMELQSLRKEVRPRHCSDRSTWFFMFSWRLSINPNRKPWMKRKPVSANVSKLI